MKQREGGGVERHANPGWTSRSARAEASRPETVHMPSNKRHIIVDESSDDEEVVYFLKPKTVKNLPMLLDAIAPLIEDSVTSFVRDDDETSETEKFLLKKLCTEPGVLDNDKIMKLLEDEKNHLQVMDALACVRGYDYDWADVVVYIDLDQDEWEIRRIWDLLPRWAVAAKEQRTRASKKRKC
jgi:hypothetical protein